MADISIIYQNVQRKNIRLFSQISISSVVNVVINKFFTNPISVQHKNYNY